ncbi:MAG TPA: hypothetical protein VK805_00540 [Candidatus Baltobacteraceae bacterium]|nr:hypothetical protein [Candidatus Baltobacteraceae bacterium]
MNKTITTLNLPAPSKADGSKQAQWEELRSVFPIYVALAKQLQLEIPIAQNKRILPEKLDPDLFSQIQKWLDVMDQQVMVHQLRHLLQMTTLNASESGLRALIMRHLRKPSKTTIDRDKADFLLVQYFALTAPPKIYHKQIELGDVANVLRPVFGEVDSTPLPWCEPLENMILALRGFKSLRDMLQTNFIEQGRRVKETAGGMFYDPSAMLAFIRFNFLMRRTLIELMHADLIFIRGGLSSLQNAGAKTIDCNSVGLGKAEPIEKLQQMTDEWKQPFQKEYTERTVNQAFEKLLGLRADVERAVEKVMGKAPTPPLIPEPEAASKKNLPSAAPTAPAAKVKEKPETAAAKHADAGGTALDFETCMEQIWEQLISAPPSRGRSMTTVKLGAVRLLMSSWEVAAFVSEDGPAAEDLRRAVVARALLSSNLESAKETGNATGLDRALTIARVEVSRLQERVEAAKQAKDTEAAVNLGISTKRLLSALDEAEKL